MDTGELIKKFREEKHLTQQELGNSVGVSVHTIMRWEKGKKSPTVDDIKKTASVLGVSVVCLIGEPLTEESNGQNEYLLPTQRHCNFAIEHVADNIRTRIEIPIEATPEQVKSFIELAGSTAFGRLCSSPR